MKKISVILVIVSVVIFGAILSKSNLVRSSYDVGWDTTGNALAGHKNEIGSMSDQQLIKEAAIVVAESYARSGKYLARYIVYFYITLSMLAFVSGFSALIIWRASNKLRQQDAAGGASA